MFSAILSFLGGSVFRMIWGELSTAWTRRTDQKHEIERMRVQAELEEAQHKRNLESIRVQHELQVEVVRVQGEVDLSKIDALTFQEGVKEGMKPTGIYLIDLWNGMVRPMAATLALWLWFRSLYFANWTMQGRDWEMVCAILGWFFADRTMGKRGK